MKLPLYNRNLFLIIFFLLILSIAGLFFSSWNNYIRNKENLFIPLVFLAVSYSLLVFLYFLFPLKGVKLKDKNALNKESDPQHETEDSSKNESLNKIDHKFLTAKLSAKTKEGEIEKSAHTILVNLSSEFSIMQGVFYSFDDETDTFSLTAAYAVADNKKPDPFKRGMGLHGQAAVNRKLVELKNLPEGFTLVMSGLGKGQAKYLYLLPLVYKDKTIALIEFSTFKSIDEDYINALQNASELLAETWMQLYKDGKKDR